MTAPAACAMPNAHPARPGQTHPVAMETPSYADLARRHNERLDRLPRLVSRGVIEMDWREDGRRRFEQGDIDLHIELPRRTSMRISKLGNTYFWLGSDDERWWLFDVAGDERVLYTGRHHSTALETGVMIVRPLVMLDLVGLSRLSEDELLAPPVVYDAGLDAWVVESPGRGGWMRIFFDRSTTLPRRIESMTEVGDVAYYSDIHMRRYISVPVAAAPPFPRIAGLVDIYAVSSPDGDFSGGRVKLSLESPTGRSEGEPFDRVFDVERLRRNLRPERIEGDPLH
jgi:hypothetical protein